MSERVVRAFPAQLTGSVAKLQRAATHVAELDAAILAFSQSRPYVAAIQDGSDGWQEVIASVNADPDPGWSTIYGEGASAIRSALDYLANELAALNGHVRRRCKYPVFTDQREFDSKIDEYLPGVHEDHVAAICDLQPFNETEPRNHPLVQMAWISNRDKHRELQPVWVLPRSLKNELGLTLEAREIGVRSILGPVIDGAVLLAIRATPLSPVLLRGQIVLDVGFGDLLLTRDHLRNANGYALWLLRTFLDAWGPADWTLPIKMGRTRLPSGPPNWEGELVVVGVDHSGQEKTIRVPALLAPSETATPVKPGKAGVDLSTEH